MSKPISVTNFLAKVMTYDFVTFASRVGELAYHYRYYNDATERLKNPEDPFLGYSQKMLSFVKDFAPEDLQKILATAGKPHADISNPTAVVYDPFFIEYKNVPQHLQAKNRLAFVAVVYAARDFFAEELLEQECSTLEAFASLVFGEIELDMVGATSHLLEAAAKQYHSLLTALVVMRGEVCKEMVAYAELPRSVQISYHEQMEHYLSAFHTALLEVINADGRTEKFFL